MPADRFADVQPNVSGVKPESFQREKGFLSLRWRLVMPLLALIMAGVMVASYVATATLTRAGQNGHVQQVQLAAQGARES